MQQQLQNQQQAGAFATGYAANQLPGALGGIGQPLNLNNNFQTNAGAPGYQYNTSGIQTQFPGSSGGQQAHTSLPYGQQASTSFQTGNMPSIDPANFKYDDIYGKVNQTLQSGLDPSIHRQEQSLGGQLAAQGIPLGSEAYKNAQNIQGENESYARNQASGQAYQTALQQQAQAYGQAANSNQQTFGQGLTRGQFGNQAIGQNFGQGLGAGQFANQGIGQNFAQGLAGAGFGNAAQAQQFGEGMQGQGQQFAQGLQNANLNNSTIPMQNQNTLMQREQPLNELASLFGFSPMQSPNFANPQAPNALGSASLAQQGNQFNYGQQMQNNSSNLGGLFGLGGSLISGLGSFFGG